MLRELVSRIQSYIFCKKGATAIEYGLIAGGISLAIVASVFTFGDSLANVFTAMVTPTQNIVAEFETNN
jgi:pilus assembly protein Flp/PilA